MSLSKTINEFFRSIRRADLLTPRVRGVLIVSLGVYVVLVGALAYAWYSKQWGSTFRFFNDAAEWKQMDKFAHFFWAFHIAAVASRLLTWARLNPPTCAVAGTLMSLVFVSSIELLDGFSESYGASVFDVIANTLGCAAFLAQRIFWSKINIWPKFSFHPSGFAPLRPSMLGNGFLEELLKDYNGQTFWYSFRAAYLPLPPWLVIAVGVGAEGMVYSRDDQNLRMNFTAHRKFLLSVDLDLSGIQPNHRWLKWALSLFTIVKFPAPAIEISHQGIKFHPIYF